MCGISTLITFTTPWTGSNCNPSPTANGTNGSTTVVNGNHALFPPQHCNGVKLNGASKGDNQLRAQLSESLKNIKHRGPDDLGMWFNANDTVALGHVRLSINDLSPSAAQPLHNPSNDIHAVVNGEIYDYDRLRTVCSEVHGYEFATHSDSELVLALYQIYGAPGFLEHLRGEFAFVLYDARPGHEKVIACRDRFGIKPLVYTTINDGAKVLFASEAKAFLPLGWKPQWDVKSIAEAGFSTDHRTLFRGVNKVLPGYYVQLTPDGKMEARRYWDAEYPEKTRNDPRSIDDMILGVRERLVESIRLRLRADVPVGIYLSGGIDSSAVAGIVTDLAKNENVKYGSQSSNTSVTCFSVRFPESSGFDESAIAERTADWLGVETIKRDVNEQVLADFFSDTAYHCEHHHWDLNAVAKFALSTLPQEHGVKVVLTGEGSDEHFAGYPYFAADMLREPERALPGAKVTVQDDKLRESMVTELDNEMINIWGNISIPAKESFDVPALAAANGIRMPETLMLWRPQADIFAPGTLTDHQDARQVVLDAHTPEVLAKMAARWHPLHTSMYMWNKAALANTLLSCLGDRTEMAHSIEARTPFLDHHLAEYVNGLPSSVKMAYTPIDVAEELNHGPMWKGVGLARQSISEKWILREAVRPYVTDELYERRKHPFLAPTRWAQGGPMHQMFQTLVTRQSVEKLGFLRWSAVERALQTAFGDAGDPSSFRSLLYVGAWVTLGERFQVAPAYSSY